MRHAILNLQGTFAWRVRGGGGRMRARSATPEPSTTRLPHRTVLKAMWIRGVIACMLGWALLGPGTAGAAGESAQRPAPDGMTYARDVAIHGSDHVVIGRSRAVYSISLAALAPGEILRIRAETELTSCRASDTGCGATNREP